MAKFLHARLTIVFVDEGLEGAKALYKEYFSKKSLKKFKEATDALLLEDEDLKSIVTDIA